MDRLLFAVLFTSLLICASAEEFNHCSYMISGAMIVEQDHFFTYGMFTGSYTSSLASGITNVFGIYDFETEMLGEKGSFV